MDDLSHHPPAEVAFFNCLLDDVSLDGLKKGGEWNGTGQEDIGNSWASPLACETSTVSYCETPRTHPAEDSQLEGTFPR